MPLENRKPLVFWCFQGVSKETSCMKWVKILSDIYDGFYPFFHQITLSQIFERVLIHLCIWFHKNCSRTSPKSKFKLKNNKRLNNKNSEVKAIRVNVNLGQAEKIASEFLLKTLNYFNQSCISYRNQVFWFVAQVKWLVCYEMQH